MRSSFKLGRLLASLVLVWLLVIKPLKANLIARFSMTLGLGRTVQASILERAYAFDECNTWILDKEGDLWQEEKNYLSAALSYGRIISCSPGNAGARFKYGAMLVLLGYPEMKYMMQEAITLEPNNPIFISYYENITSHQLLKQ